MLIYLSPQIIVVQWHKKSDHIKFLQVVQLYRTRVCMSGNYLVKNNLTFMHDYPDDISNYLLDNFV